MNFSRIGLAVTFSPTGVALLSEAYRLSELLEADLVLLHVGERGESLENKLKEMIIKAGISDGKYDLIWAKGDPVRAILSAVSENNIDLLLMGALEKEKSINYYLGSIARKIMRETVSSILIFTSPSENPEEFGEIFAVTNYLEGCEKVISTAYNLAKVGKSPNLTVIREFQLPGLGITVSDSGDLEEIEKNRERWIAEEKEKLNFFLLELNISDPDIKKVVLFGKEGWVANEYAKEKNAGLLVVSAPKRKPGIFDRIFTHDFEFTIKELPKRLLIIK